jgi:glutamine synthetase
MRRHRHYFSFIGEQLTKVLANNLETVSDGSFSQRKNRFKIRNVVGKIPDVLLDNTDRNRTSPFAFTGNKWEFRAVGSSANYCRYNDNFKCNCC